MFFWYYETKYFRIVRQNVFKMVYQNFHARQMDSADFELFSARRI